MNFFAHAKKNLSLKVKVVTPHHVAHNLKLLFLKDYDGAVGFFPKKIWISSIFLPLCYVDKRNMYF